MRSLFACLFLILPAVRAAWAEKPNVVFVLFDDLGYGQPGCYRGDSEFRTPNLDRLSREGMRFTDAHSAASVCTPTRYGILTGRYPARLGQYGVLTTYSPPIIPAGRPTVASFLREHGYDTACIGKWHLGIDWLGKPGSERHLPEGTEIRRGPTGHGFDYFYGYTHARNIGTVIEQECVRANVAETEAQPRLADKMLDYLSAPARRDRPFFLYLPLCPPHTPIAPSGDFVGKGGASGAYGDWLSQGDWVLGRLLDALESLDLARNTVVWVSSDNGAAGRSYPPLRGAKGSIYEGGHRVPFLARWPGRIPAGTVCDDTVCLNDLFATCADLLGAKIPDHAAEDSVSILPDLLGTATMPVREATVHQAPDRSMAIRQGSWKLVLQKGGGRELYNLATDPGEARDVGGVYPETVARLAALLEKYRVQGRSTPGMPQKNEAPFPAR